ncbi:hypothetical protein PC9H_009281 [Pleurotus ostreatus]|uniref:F-box domain-containing protein n=1 Tax=Pleurotus ostreatus TaxID=5322 RepID=A0A8H6ZR28_PLEOS|nr:uncharacterized protein PC9H_009281 [Pleurotus ostreatus]KAF7423981.1 hypothetical protein PC9H_009281 [Pleurotus ostreatus]
MNSHGYKVSRHKGRFYTEFLPSSAHLPGHGLDIARSIPQDSSEYAHWLHGQREYLDKVADEVQTQDGKLRHSSLTISSVKPLDGVVEHIYEIDYDSETFCYGGFPMFRLDSMPSESVFVSYFDTDSFKHPIPSTIVPKENLYRISEPLPPKQDDIDLYKLYQEPTGNYMALQETLRRYSSLSDAQDVRIRLFEIIVRAFMSDKLFHSYMCCSMLSSSDNDGSHACVPEFLEEAGLKLLLVAFLPMHFGGLSSAIHAKAERGSESNSSETGYLWIHRTLCAKAAIHLQDEPTLRGSVGGLVRHIRNTGKQGVVYGVLCSLWQVVIVRVDMSNEGEGSVEHTPALDFLPPRRLQGPWASGLTMLMQLSFHLERSIFDDLDIVDPSAPSPPPTPCPQTLLDKLPTELLMEICSYLPSLLLSQDALIAFGKLNSEMEAFVAPIVFRPSVAYCSLRSIAERTTGADRERWERTGEAFTEDRFIPRLTYGRPPGILVTTDGGCGSYVRVFEIQGVGLLKLQAITASVAVVALGS